MSKELPPRVKEAVLRAVTLERGEYDECEECPSRISVAEWDDDGAFAGSYDCGEEHCAVGRSA